MTETERAALRDILEDGFRLRSELHHARTVIAEATNLLEGPVLRKAMQADSTKGDMIPMIGDALGILKKPASR